MMAGTTGRRFRAAAWPHADIRLLLGVVLVIVALVGGLSFWRAARTTEPVVIAARPIAAGHIVTAEDLTLTEARLEGPLAGLALRDGDRAALMGQTVAVPIPAGAMVVRPDVGSGPVVGAEQVAITVPVPADSVFPGLHRGDRVTVLGTSEPGRPSSLTAVLLDGASVYAVSSDSSRVSLGGGNNAAAGRITNVTILVPRDRAEQLTHVLVNGTLTLVIAGGEPAR